MRISEQIIIYQPILDSMLMTRSADDILTIKHRLNNNERFIFEAVDIDLHVAHDAYRCLSDDNSFSFPKQATHELSVMSKAVALLASLKDNEINSSSFFKDYRKLMASIGSVPEYLPIILDMFSSIVTMFDNKFSEIIPLKKLPDLSAMPIFQRTLIRVLMFKVFCYNLIIDKSSINHIEDYVYRCISLEYESIRKVETRRAQDVLMSIYSGLDIYTNSLASLIKEM